MKFVSQPETYSDVLERIFYATLFAGLLCTFALATASPEVAHLLARVGTEAELGPIKQLKLLYVVVPFLIALVSRIIKLHDRVSDALRLRYHIDTQWILTPLAVGVGITLDDEKRRALGKGRRGVMYAVFYPYVSLPDAEIDHQLVRSALDSLGWMWALIEATLLFAITTVLLFIFGARGLGIWWTVFASLGALGATGLWFVCKRNTTAEVKAILSDPYRCDEVRGHLVALGMEGALPNPAVAPSKGVDKTGAGSVDLFISHASEDKVAIARPLYEALTAAGISVWFDEATLRLGDSLRRKIDEGLANCRFGVVILSPHFLSKEWPQLELDGLVARETVSGQKAILPVWHDIDAAALAKHSPTLAGKLAAHSRQGIPKIVEQIRAVLGK